MSGAVGGQKKKKLTRKTPLSAIKSKQNVTYIDRCTLPLWLAAIITTIDKTKT